MIYNSSIDVVNIHIRRADQRFDFTARKPFPVTPSKISNVRDDFVAFRIGVIHELVFRYLNQIVHELEVVVDQIMWLRKLAAPLLRKSDAVIGLAQVKFQNRGNIVARRLVFVRCSPLGMRSREISSETEGESRLVRKVVISLYVIENILPLYVLPLDISLLSPED